VNFTVECSIATMVGMAYRLVSFDTVGFNAQSSEIWAGNPYNIYVNWFAIGV